MISIDFVAGSHGRFLEYVCNKYVAGTNADHSPFNNLGASHLVTKEYLAGKVFYANHYSELKLPVTKKLIRISFQPDDLLPLTAGTFFRAGDANLQEEQLDINTYFKLKNSYFHELVDSINATYPEADLSIANPDCPRHILREFFKFGFKDINTNGFMNKLGELVYSSEHEVFDFPYKNFYNKELFVNGIESVAGWYGVSDIDTSGLDSLWLEFYNKQRHKNLKSQCDAIIDAVVKLENVTIGNLSILQESYINGMLEKQFDKEMPFYQPSYFKTTNEIISYLCLK